MTLERIQIGDKEIILIGTAHISQASADLVKETIETEKPQVVGIELDIQRFKQLQNPRKWQQTNVKNVIQEGKTYLLLLNIFLTNLQRRFGESVNVRPGQEMIIAAQLASKQKIPIALLDRNIEVTMKRAFSLTPLKEKIKIFFYLVSGLFGGDKEELTPEIVEKLKQSDMVTQLIQELGRKAPTVKKVLVDERDAFIASQILKNPAKKLVCVVGAGHLNGIKELLLQQKTVDERKLMQLPKKGNLGKIVQWSIPAVLIVFLVWAFLAQGITGILNLAIYWILITGIFSAIGAALARSHPFTIITAFMAAPLTTVHPLLASGWFAAAVEAKYKHPQVKDFENLNQLNSYRDFERNKVTHLLLVAAFTNLGSTIGVIIALPTILSLLA
ncbi:TraB/GumN family protein [Candidatus Micrarchaeota archaeon]|nr:TraB/GumN family protein [Candidatus Micrarchaeota archaeon]MBU1930865.1 TraB/GumN family protein [Candidatus Micrarchaeota archaeon]